MRKHLVPLMLFLFLVSTCTSPRDFVSLNRVPAHNFDANRLAPTMAVLLKSNDLAFASKIDIIRNAKKELRLMYYIFNPDQSTSYLTFELIKKIEADPDFRISILTDYHWNYKNLDFFRWLENQQPHGHQQIEVRFYNRPTVNVIKFAEFMTIGCQDGILADSLDQRPACSQEKLAYLTKFDQMNLEEAEAAMSPAAKMFLAGLYSKDPDMLLYSFQHGYARTIDKVSQSEMTAGGVTEEQKKQLATMAQLYWKSKFGAGSQRFGAKLKLTIAGILFGKHLNPVINAMETYLPFTLRDVDNNPILTHPDIDYLTDYIHHKYILADEKAFQIGGRNLENSYHMRPNSLTAKYTFMDTDVYMELNEEDGHKTKEYFEDLWNFKKMVASTKDIAQHAPIAYVYMVREATKLAEESCKGEGDMMAQQRCAGGLVASIIEKGKESFVERQQAEWKQLVENARDEYINQYLEVELPGKTWTRHQDIFDSQRDHIAENVDVFLHHFSHYHMTELPFYYVENLPYDQGIKLSPEQRRRSYGSAYGVEIPYGKAIHKIWTDAVNAACEKSLTSDKPVEVIIHQGYFSPPAGLVQLMDYMLEAGPTCPNVKLKIYTNSQHSTDLAPVSFLGRRQLFALSKVNDLKRDNFAYYEYNKEVLDEIVAEKYVDQQLATTQVKGQRDRASFSLHSKVMIFGDAIYIGSSNADIRSYMMDTNNGIFIKNAPYLVRRYKGFLEELESRDIVMPANATFDFADEKALGARERADIEELIAKYGMEKHLESKERQQEFERVMEQINWVLKTSSDLTFEMVNSNTMDQKPLFDSYFKML